MASTMGLEFGPHWWETSVLITGPPLHPKEKDAEQTTYINYLVKRKFTALKQFKIQMFRRVRASFRSR